MAARKSSTLHPRHRSAIKTSMLVKRLQAFVLSEEDAQTGRAVEMSKAQVAAALGLLRKTMPDLAVTQIEAAPGTAAAFVIYGERQAPDAAAWQQDNPPPT